MSKESNQEGPVRVRKLISPPLVSFSGEPATPVMSGSEAQKLATKEERMREHYRRAAATSLWVLNLDEEEMASLLNSPVPEKPTPSEQQKEPVNRRQRAGLPSLSG